jgi:hypothetical protein
MAPLNVSPEILAVTDQPPEHEIDQAARDVLDPVIGDVSVIVNGPDTANGALLWLNRKTPDHVPASARSTVELHEPPHCPCSGRETQD